MLNQLRNTPDSHVVEVQGLLCVLNASVLQVSTGERKDRICDRRAPSGQGQDELLEGVAGLFAENDEMGQDVAEMVEECASVLPIRKLREHRRAEV